MGSTGSGLLDEPENLAFLKWGNDDYRDMPGRQIAEDREATGRDCPVEGSASKCQDRGQEAYVGGGVEAVCEVVGIEDALQYEDQEVCRSSLTRIG